MTFMKLLWVLNQVLPVHSSEHHPVTTFNLLEHGKNMRQASYEQETITFEFLVV